MNIMGYLAPMHNKNCDMPTTSKAVVFLLKEGKIKRVLAFFKYPLYNEDTKVLGYKSDTLSYNVKNSIQTLGGQDAIFCCVGYLCMPMQ